MVLARFWALCRHIGSGARAAAIVGPLAPDWCAKNNTGATQPRHPDDDAAAGRLRRTV